MRNPPAFEEAALLRSGGKAGSAVVCFPVATSRDPANAGPAPLHKQGPATAPTEARPPVRKRGFIIMANILVNIEKGVEIGAEDALKWLSGANKALKATPAVVAALATLISAVEKPLSEVAGVAANPLNVPLDIQTVNDLKAVWPDVKQFLTTLGVKF
jgi:hypothetical protein